MSFAKPRPIVAVEEVRGHEEPSILVLYERDQEQIVAEIAGVLGQQWRLIGPDDSNASPIDGTVIGISDAHDTSRVQTWRGSSTVLATHCLDDPNPAVGSRSSVCDYEYLYTTKPFLR